MTQAPSRPSPKRQPPPAREKAPVEAHLPGRRAVHESTGIPTGAPPTPVVNPKKR